MALTLILGGARSGKSAFAQRAAEVAAAGRAPVMIATAQPFDEEMRERIARHRAERGEAWRTVEAPFDLARALGELGAEDVAVVDCLTLWLSNVILANQDVADARSSLLSAAGRCRARLWLVSNEVGLGIVPENALARLFRDEAGRLHQAVAELADEVTLMVAGLPLQVKPARA